MASDDIVRRYAATLQLRYETFWKDTPNAERAKELARDIADIEAIAGLGGRPAAPAEVWERQISRVDNAAVRKWLEQHYAERRADVDRMVAAVAPVSSGVRPVGGSTAVATTEKPEDRARTERAEAQKALRHAAVSPVFVTDVKPARRGFITAIFGPRAAEREQARQATNLARSTAKAQALATTHQLQGLCSTAFEAVDTIAALAVDCTGRLDEAEHEYRANAFGSYWDAVEAAAVCIGQAERQYERIVRGQQTYAATLEELDANKRSHNFPAAFPVRASMVATFETHLDRLQRVARQGQTNFQFAVIWEQRQTRQVMIGGFRTLGAALDGLAGAVKSSTSNLQRALSTQLNAVTSHQAQQTEMLDNIQRGRQPLF